MKTKILLSATALLLSGLFAGPAFAAEPAYARTCRIAGGQAWTVDLHQKNDLTLCVFGAAAVGAAEFSVYKWEKGTGQSLAAFLNQSSQLDSNTVCESVGASVRTSLDSEGNSWSLCEFADGSVVEANTLANGVNATSNEALVAALTQASQ